MIWNTSKPWPDEPIDCIPSKSADDEFFRVVLFDSRRKATLVWARLLKATCRSFHVGSNFTDLVFNPTSNQVILIYRSGKVQAILVAVRGKVIESVCKNRQVHEVLRKLSHCQTGIDVRTLCKILALSAR